jgi:hypothetical protein
MGFMDKGNVYGICVLIGSYDRAYCHSWQGPIVQLTRRLPINCFVTITEVVKINHINFHLVYHFNMNI